MFNKFKKFFGIDWTYINRDGESFRINSRNRLQGFCSELGEWKDYDFLAGTNYDGGVWNKMIWTVLSIRGSK